MSLITAFTDLVRFVLRVQGSCADPSLGLGAVSAATLSIILIVAEPARSIGMFDRVEDIRLVEGGKGPEWEET